MSDDWKPGDLAVCVDARKNPGCPYPTMLVEGRVYTVSGIAPLSPNQLLGPARGLFLEGVAHPPRGCNERRFRKIRPDEPKACEEEFRILLQLSKGRVKA